MVHSRAGAWERVMPVPLSDESLLDKASTDAFTDLYHRYADRVYRYAVARLGNAMDAQDVTAQTFLTAFESLDRFQQRGSFAAWLFGIARHKVQDHQRRARPLVPLDNVLDMPSSGLPLEDAVDEQLWINRAIHAIDKLSTERAEALRLRIFAGLSAAEIGSIMGKSEDAVRMLAHRAIQDLQAYLEDK